MMPYLTFLLKKRGKAMINPMSVVMLKRMMLTFHIDWSSRIRKATMISIKTLKMSSLSKWEVVFLPDTVASVCCDSRQSV